MYFTHHICDTETTLAMEYNDRIYIWERKHTWKLKVGVRKHLKVIVAPHHELVELDHMSICLDLKNTRWRDETDQELMLCDLVHVSHTRNFKTVQSDNRTGFQIVLVVAGPVSGYKPVNNTVL